MQEQYSYKNHSLEILFLFLSLVLCFLLVLSIIFSPMNENSFRDYLFLREIFNGKLLLMGAPCGGIHGVRHGVLGYWFLYPLITAKYYYFVKILVLTVNILALVLFTIWLTQKFSSLIAFFCIVNTLLHLPFFFFYPYHQSFTVFFYCVLLSSLLKGNWLGTFISIFSLSQMDLINFILFVPLIFACLKQKNYKYLYPSIFFIIYFFIYVFKMNYSQIMTFDFSFLNIYNNHNVGISHSVRNIKYQIIVPFIFFVIFISYKKHAKNMSPLVLNYLLCFSILYGLISIFLNGYTIYFAILPGFFIGCSAYLFLPTCFKCLGSRFPIFKNILLLIFSYIAINFVWRSAASSYDNFSIKKFFYSINPPKQSLHISPKYFLNNTFVKKNSRYATSKECAIMEYEILLNLDFGNNYIENKYSKYFLIQESIFKNQLVADKRYFRKEKSFKKGYSLYSISSSKFKKDDFKFFYPLRYCLSESNFVYNLKTRRVEEITLMESYLNYVNEKYF